MNLRKNTVKSFVDIGSYYERGRKSSNISIQPEDIGRIRAKVEEVVLGFGGSRVINGKLPSDYRR